MPLLLGASSTAGQQSSCVQFQKELRTTYDFKPSRLSSEAEGNAKTAAMDRFWQTVKTKPALIFCLRNAIADSQSDPWFRFDGSNLLVSLDPSAASKAEQVRQYTMVDLNDVDPKVWVTVMAQRAVEGFDVSEGATRWLTNPKADYFLAEHGAVKVDAFIGAFFIFGSMDETFATPALLKVAADAKHPARERALTMLLYQATPDAFSALKAANKVGRSPAEQADLLKLLANPKRVEPRAQPKTTRAEFVQAFDAYLQGNRQPFMDLVSKVPDGERDVAAVLRPEDLPLLRKMRRAMMANANQHAFEYYTTFTEILMALVWRPELVN
jgi:hypothetical protein